MEIERISINWGAVPNDKTKAHVGWCAEEQNGRKVSGVLEVLNQQEAIQPVLEAITEKILLNLQED